MPESGQIDDIPTSWQGMLNDIKVHTNQCKKEVLDCVRGSDDSSHLVRVGAAGGSSSIELQQIAKRMEKLEALVKRNASSAPAFSDRFDNLEKAVASNKKITVTSIQALGGHIVKLQELLDQVVSSGFQDI